MNINSEIKNIKGKHVFIRMCQLAMVKNEEETK
jgi:hypothetical protein